ncbi:MAG TPA: hypothetical protein VGG28_29375 [Kofleriaceae bacterium]|jgi:hypothetical protein
MSRQVTVALYLIAMIVVIVGVDLAFLKDRPLPRLFANVGIVLVFVAIYLRFLRSP